MGTKTKPAAQQTIDEYIRRFPAATQRILRAMRRTIRRAAPGATEAMRYGIPTFILGRNLVHFAAWAKHVSFYPTSSGIRRFRRELSPYVTSRGTVQFPYDEPVPHDLIAAITCFRVEEERTRSSGVTRPARVTVRRGGDRNVRRRSSAESARSS